MLLHSYATLSCMFSKFTSSRDSVLTSFTTIAIKTFLAVACSCSYCSSVQTAYRLALSCFLKSRRTGSSTCFEYYAVSFAGLNSRDAARSRTSAPLGPWTHLAVDLFNTVIFASFQRYSSNQTEGKLILVHRTVLQVSVNDCGRRVEIQRSLCSPVIAVSDCKEICFSFDACTESRNQ